MSEENSILELYAVRSQDGLWLRRKGYGGGGESWVEDPKKARIYPKPGSARSQITWWKNNHPEYGTPDLVKFIVTKIEVVDERSRRQRLEEEKQQRELAAKVKKHKKLIDSAKKQIAESEKSLEELTS